MGFVCKYCGRKLGEPPFKLDVCARCFSKRTKSGKLLALEEGFYYPRLVKLFTAGMIGATILCMRRAKKPIVITEESLLNLLSSLEKNF